MTAKKKKGVDLDSLEPYGKADTPHRFELHTPEITGDDGEVVKKPQPTGIYISVLGSNSTEYQRQTREAQNEALRLRYEQEQGKPKAKPPTMDEAIEKASQLLAAVTVGWENVERGGEPFPFSVENAVELYSDPRFGWIRVAVDREVHDLGNFI